MEKISTKKPSSSSSVVLNDMDLLGDILSRTPAESLLRVKSVCKNWEALVKNDQFVLQHYTYQKAKKQSVGIALITSAEDFCNFDLTILNGVGDEIVSASKEKQKSKEFEAANPEKQTANLEEQQSEDFVLTVPTYRFVMISTCNGLIFLHTKFPMLIWNPVTKQSIAFGKPKYASPKEKFGTLCGFGFDATTGKYKMVQLYQRISDWAVECEVFVLGTDMSWRQIQLQANFEDLDLEDPDFGPNSVFLEGTLYWPVKSGVLCFEVATEIFKLIPGINSSQCAGRPGRCVNYLVELEGGLCRMEHFMDAGVVTIWKLQNELIEQQKNPWVMQYELDVQRFSGGSPVVHMKTVYMDKKKICLKYWEGLGFYDIESRFMGEPFFSVEFYEQGYSDCISFTKSAVSLRNIIGSCVPGGSRITSTGNMMTLELETAATVGRVKASIQEMV